MTVGTEHASNSFTGNGSQTTFNFTFAVLVSNPGVDVYVNNVLQSSGVSVLPNGNQVTNPGGSIVFSSAPANGAVGKIVRDTAQTQDFDIPLESRLNTQSLETALDKAVLMIQENKRDLADRTFVWKGTWSSAVAYIPGDAVFYQGNSYICILASTNNAPPNATYWNTLAEGGGIEWRGAWSGATAYVINDAVSSGGNSYICILAHTNQVPPNATYWNLLAQKGDAGIGSGTVTSVAQTVPSFMSVTGSPVTTTGTLAISFNTQSGRKFLASPDDGSSGALDMRAIVNADIPTTLTGKTLGATTTLSAAPVPSAAAGIDIGTDALPFRDIYVADNGGANSMKFTVAVLSGDRTFTLPNANCNPVQPATAGASQFATAISSAGVISFAQPASSDLSDASNVALRNNSNSWSTAQIPNALGTIDLGSTTRAWKDIYIANGGSNYTILRSGTLTGNRTVTTPDADSTTVIGTTATSNQFLTHITTGGVQTKAQPSSSNLSDAANIALVNNANNFSTAQLPSALGTIDLGSTTRAWKDIYIANGGSNYTILRSGSLTGNRTVTFPDANSNTVVPSTAGSNQFATAISSAGVVTWTQPSFSNISGTAAVTQGGTGLTTIAIGEIMVGSGTNTIGKLAAGVTDGHVLTWDSAEPLKVKWAAAAGGGGGNSWSVQSKSANFQTTDASGAIYRVDTSGGAITVTMDDAAADGSVYRIVRSAGTNKITVNREGTNTINFLGTSLTTFDITDESVIELTKHSGGYTIT